jgi:AcrR family transcriptional regulator
MVDSRILQTQTALTRAILELASERPVSQIPVSEVARRAGINRATFYNHYLSPGNLLAAVLGRELDRVREADHTFRSRAGAPREEATRLSVEAVVMIVQKHRRVFELALLDPQDASLHRALAAHVEESCREHLARYALESEPVPDVDIVAGFVAEGIVGGIEAWLAKPRVDAGRLTDAIMSAMPRWWR